MPLKASSYNSIFFCPSDINDLFKVKSKLLGATHRWKHIGLALGLKNDRLNLIHSSHRTAEDSLMVMAMVTDWLNRAYDTVEHGEPTLQRLSEAVRNPAGGNNPALADSILLSN